jgi:hypothetical protein
MKQTLLFMIGSLCVAGWVAIMLLVLASFAELVTP